MHVPNLDYGLEVGRSSHDKSWNALTFASSLRSTSILVPSSYIQSLVATAYDNSAILQLPIVSGCVLPATLLIDSLLL